MDRATAFSYACNACGLCCRDKVITLSPYDVLRIARAGGVATSEAVRRYTIRRGSILKFGSDGRCVALAGSRCTLHRGRPLACRLYPLGMERDADEDRFMRLEPAPGSAGVYGAGATVAAFVAEQGADEYLRAVERYAALIPAMRARVDTLIDFTRVEPREFWRVAVREATAESGFDPNRLIDALFDPDSLRCARVSDADTVSAHLEVLEALAMDERDASQIAAAAVMLATSLGYSPAHVIGTE